MPVGKPHEHARNFAIDLALGALWAAAILAAVLFSSGASTFIYIDF